MGASDTMQKLIRRSIDESQYLNKVGKRSLSNDVSYLYKSGDIGLFDDEFEEKLINKLPLVKLIEYFSESIGDTKYSFSKMVDEIVKRYNEGVETVEGFIDECSSNKDGISGLDKILNNDNEVSFKWWEVNSNYSFRKGKTAAVVAGLQDGVEISGKKIKRSKCLKDEAIPIKYMGTGLHHQVNFLTGTDYDNRYKARSHNNQIINYEKVVDLPEEKRDKLIAVLSNSNCSIERLPDSIVESYYEHYEDKLVEKARKSSDIKERLEDIGVDDIEDKIIDTSYENLIDIFEQQKSLRNRNVRHYNSDYSVNRIKSDMKNLPDDKLKEVWNREYEYTSGGETLKQTIPDICTATVLQDIAWDLSCLSVLDNEIKTKIVKNKVRKANSKRSTHSISWPSFDINKEVLDGLTALQLAKFINLIKSRNKGKLDLADQNFYKQKLSRKIFKGDERAKEAMDKVKDALNDDNDDNDDNKNKSSSSKKKTKQGIIEEKSRDAYKQLNDWVSDFTSFGDLVEYIKDKNEDLMDEAVFTQLWDKISHSDYSNRLEYNVKDTSKTNIKIIKELVNNGLDNLTIPEVDDE